MTNLPNETITAVFELQRRLLQITHQATELEFNLLKQFGETEATITELDEIQNVKERASSYYIRLFRLLLQISQSQLAERTTHGEPLQRLTRVLFCYPRFIRDIIRPNSSYSRRRTGKYNRNKEKLEFIMNQQPKIPDKATRERSIAKMREISMMFDAQIMVLDELIARVEAQNRQSSINIYRQKQGKRLLTSLQQEIEN